nr:hypothetical protein [Legionella jordanis]
MGWELQRNDIRMFIVLYLLLLLEASFSSLSLISRSSFIFHVVPILFVYAFNRNKIMLSYQTILLLLALTGGLFCCSLYEVSVFRGYYYSGDFLPLNETRSVTLGTAKDQTEGQKRKRFSSLEQHSPILGFLGESFNANSQPYIEEFAKIFGNLVVDRWLGMEGVMAVVSYPKKSIMLLKEALFRKQKLGEMDIYQDIAQSQYRHIDSSRFTFATLPGAIAFLYYSGSGLIVWMGMAFLTGLMMLGERSVFFMTQSNLLCAAYGVSIAYSIEQFGFSPIDVLKYYILVFAFFVMVFFLKNQSVNGNASWFVRTT